MDNELRHYGVMGMKWGKRQSGFASSVNSRINKVTTNVTKTVSTHNSNEKAYRDKLTAISKNKNMDKRDLKKIQQRNKPLSTRIVTTAAGATAGIMVKRALTGKGLKMTPDEIRTAAIQVAKTTTKTLAMNEITAKSASNRYNADGSKKAGKAGKTGKFLNKEDKMELAIGTGIRAAQLAQTIITVKAAKTAISRSRNEEIFRQWGQNILEEKLSDITFIRDVVYTVH